MKYVSLFFIFFPLSKYAELNTWDNLNGCSGTEDTLVDNVVLVWSLWLTSQEPWFAAEITLSF